MVFQATSHHLIAPPSPFGYVFIAVAAVAVGQSWLSSRGFYRLAARRGGWRLAVAILASAASLVFGIGIALGQFAIGIAALVLGGLASALLYTEFRRAASG